MKDIAIRNTHLKYESPTKYQSKVLTKAKVIEKNQTPRSKIRGPRSLYQMKGLARKNTPVKYESPITYQSNVMTKVNVFKSRSNSKVRGSGHSYHKEYTFQI
jgi:hypothetical protein